MRRSLIIGAVTRREMPIKVIAASGLFDDAYLENGKKASVLTRPVPAKH
jgi:hypothetical protein